MKPSPGPAGVNRSSGKTPRSAQVARPPPPPPPSTHPPAEPLRGGGLISADIYGRRPICCTLRSFHALPEVLCNYPDIDEGWFQQVIAGSSAVFTLLSKMSLSITSGKLISTQWPYLLIIYGPLCVCACVCNPRQSSEPWHITWFASHWDHCGC